MIQGSRSLLKIQAEKNIFPVATKRGTNMHTTPKLSLSTLIVTNYKQMSISHTTRKREELP